MRARIAGFGAASRADHFSTGMKRRKIRDDGSMSPRLHYKPKSRSERSHKKSRPSFDEHPVFTYILKEQRHVKR
jgi:hypothetical protein